jgi:DNA-binding CsgD family transcriptional regulator
VASLLDKSLLQQTEHEGAEPRLFMLETIREYGLERLRESGETYVCQRAHALYYLTLVEEVEPKLIGAEHVNLMERLEQEHDNLRATLGWLLEQNEMELLLRLSGALRIYWEMRGYFSKKAFAAAWVQGRTMKPEQALVGLQRASLPEPVAAKPPSSPSSPTDLTAREMDVLRLLAQGLTSAQIAEQLVIGLVTVNSHVRSIYSKLGVTSRAAATRYALEHKLI